MANRFSVTRKRVTIAGCVFCAIAVGLLATGGVQAAMILSELSGSGGFLAGGSALTWQISNSNNTGLPLVCGQEIVMASAVDSFLATGDGSTYKSRQALQNGDLITMQTEREVAFNEGVYQDSLWYEGAGAGNPEGGCGIDQLIAVPTGESENETIPAVDPYCSTFFAGSHMMGSGIKYQGMNVVTSGDLELPDSAGFQMAGSGGNGFGSVSMRSASITPYYRNSDSQSLIAGGKPFALEGKFQFTSFAKTFDESPEAAG